MKTSSIKSLLLWLFASVIATSAPAAVLTWSGNGTTAGGVGTWNTTSLTNWSSTGAAPFDQQWNNAATNDATFQGTAGAVTVNSAITMRGNMNLNITGYSTAGTGAAGTITFAPGSTINIPSGTITLGGVYAGTITKTGAGTVALNNSGGNVARVIVNGGTLSAAAPNRYGTGADVSDFFTLNGGVLSVNTTTSWTHGRSMVIGANGGGIAGGTAGFVVNLDKPVTGNGGGTLTNTMSGHLLFNTNGNSGNYTIRMEAGTLRIGGSEFISDSSSLVAFGGSVNLAGGHIRSISVTAGGSGYTTAPTVAFDNTNTGGSGAAATAVVVSGAVTRIDITNVGSGYTNAPTISFTGVGTGAAATCTIIPLGPYTETVDTVTIGSSSSTISGGTLIGTSYVLQAGTISSILGGFGAATKTTTGSVTLSGANTFSGGLTLSAGTLAVGNNSAAGTGTLILNGGTIQSSSGTARTLTNAVTLGGTVTFGSTAGLTFSGPLTLTGNRTLTVNNTNTVSGVIGETGGSRNVTVNGTGRLQMNNSANTYSGMTTVSNGATLGVDADGTIGNGAGAVILAGGTLLNSADRDAVLLSNDILLAANSTISSLSTAAANQFRFGGDLTGATGTLTLRNDGADGATDRFEVGFAGGGINFGQPIVIDNGATGLTRLEFLNTNGTVDQTFSGVISGDGNINRASGGNTILTGDNTFTGGVILSSGSIGVGHDNALSTGTITATGGGLFASGTARVITNDVTFTGGLIADGANNLEFSGSLSLGGGTRTITVDNTATTTLSGSISSTVLAGNNAWTKSGAGILVISGANTYDGNTTVNDGTLKVANGFGSATGQGTVNVTATGVLGGNGTVAAISLSSGGAVAPGASIGTFNTTNATFGAAGVYKFEVEDSGGGIATDLLSADNTLTITATPASPFVIDLTSLGSLANFNNTQNYSWVLATASGGITGFAPENFTVSTVNFTPSLNGGAFGVTLVGNSLVLNFGVPPAITLQPIPATVAVGGEATFSVTAIGSSLNYQWKKNGSAIPGATNSGYTLDPVIAGDAGTYSVIVYNDYGSQISSGALLSIPPSISTQPVGATKNPGDNHTFSVTADGQATLSYQWKKDGVDILDATNASYSITTISGTNAGSYKVTVSNGAGTLDSSEVSLNVSPEITLQPVGITTNGGATMTLTVAASGSAPLTYQWRVNATNLADEVDHIIGATSSTLMITNAVGSDSGNYDVVVTNPYGSSNSQPAVVTVTVVKADQTIDFGALTNKTYGDGPVTVSATSSSGLPVSFGVAGPATILGNQITITGAGTVTVTASQGGNDDYNAAPDVEQSFTVNKAVLTVSADNKNRSYGSANPALTASYNGFVNGENLLTSGVTGSPELSSTATATTAVGDYDITITQGTLGASNYSFVVANGTLTVTKASLAVNADNKSRAYGDANPTLTVNYTGFVNDETEAVLSGAPDISTTATVTNSVGVYPITPSVGTLSATNYAFTFNQGTLTVTNAPLSLLVDNKSKVHGTVNPTFTGTINGIRNSNDITASYTTTATTGSPAGNYEITGSLSDNSTGALTNYDVSITHGTLTVTKADQTIEFGELAARTYGNAPFTITATASSGLTVSFGIAGPATITGNEITITGAGTVTVTASQGGNDDYNAAPEVQQSFTVNKAALTVSADNKTRLYGDANPTLTVNYTGFVNDETEAVLSGAPDISTTATVTNSVGGYPVTPSVGTLSATNYAFTFNQGTLTVTNAPLSLVVDNKSKVHGTVNPTFTGTINGIRNSDDITASYTTTATTGSPAGNYEITGSLSDNSTGALTNYDVSITHGTLTVTKADQTIEFDALAAKTYGNAPFTISATASSGLTVSFGIAGPATITGNEITITGAGTVTVTASQGGNDDYNAAPDVEQSFTVNKTVLTVSADNKNRSYGSANPALTASYNGFVNGENLLTSGVTGSPELSTTATAATAVGDYDITITQGTLSADNYSFVVVNGTLTITKTSLAVNADNKSRAYGDANPTLTVNYTGFVNDETEAVLSGTLDISTTATVTNSVGDYPITPSLGTLSATNYAFTFNQGTLTVTNAPLSLVVDDKSKAQGAANPTFTGTITGIRNSDDIAASYTTTATNDSPAGDYEITGSLSDNSTGALTNYDVSITHGTLTISEGVSIVTHPAPQTVNQGGTATFTVSATGSGLNYQWRLNGVDISGATDTTYTDSDVQPADAGNYTVVVSNIVASVESNPALLTVIADPVQLFINLVSTNEAQLSWTTNATGFDLQSSTTLEPGSWTNVSAPVIVQGNLNTVTVPNTNSSALFRLFKP